MDELKSEPIAKICTCKAKNYKRNRFVIKKRPSEGRLPRDAKSVIFNDLLIFFMDSIY
jgi:hypothetical protein